MELKQILTDVTVSTRVKYRVTLTEAERAALERLVHTGRAAATTLTHARILLKADEGPTGPGWLDEAIAVAVEVSLSTIARVRQRCVEEGVAAALVRKPATWRTPRKLDGRQEAHLVALVCSEPPEGYAHWTLRLVRDRFVALAEVGVPVSHETIRHVLKKTNSSRGRARSGASPLLRMARS